MLFDIIILLVVCCTATRGMGKCQATWTSLPPSLHLALSTRYSDHGPLSPLTLGSTVNSLGRMSAHWDTLPPVMQVTLLKSFSSLERYQPSEQATANLLWGLGQMGASGAGLDSQGGLRPLLAAFVAAAPHFTAQGLANALHGLARMGVRYSSFSPAMRSATEEACRRCLAPTSAGVSLGDVEVAALVRSLALSGTPWRRGYQGKPTKKEEEEEDDDVLMDLTFDSDAQGASSHSARPCSCSSYANSLNHPLKQ